MKVVPILLASLSVILILSTLVCGLWLRSKGSDPEGVAFHLKLAVPTVAITVITLILIIRL